MANTRTIVTYSILGLNERIIDSDDVDPTMFDSVV